MGAASGTLVAAVFVLAVRGNGSALAMLVGLLPWLIFWGLDAYYLRQERMYRALYDHVRLSDPDPRDRFTLDARRFRECVSSWSATLFATPSCGFTSLFLRSSSRRPSCFH